MRLISIENLVDGVIRRTFPAVLKPPANAYREIQRKARACADKQGRMAAPVRSPLYPSSLRHVDCVRAADDEVIEHPNLCKT